MFALLPPSSSVTGMMRLAALTAISRPTRVEPVKTTLATPGCSTSRAPATGPVPGSTWKTSGGNPTSRPSAASRCAVSGVCSAGLRTTVFPAASAGATPQAAIGIGKFHGAITPTTPTGSLNVTSMPPDTGI